MAVDTARTRLTEDQVPEPPAGADRLEQPNGDVLIVSGDERWRFNRDGKLRYYMRLQPGQDRSVLPYEALYQGRRR